MAASAAIPSTMERENNISRRRLARLSRHAIRQVQEVNNWRNSPVGA